MMPNLVFRIETDASIMAEFIDAAVYAVETGQLTEDEATETLAEFIICRPVVAYAQE